MSRKKSKDGEKYPLADRHKNDAKQHPKPEHKVLVSGAIQAHPPPDVTKQHEAERKADAATHETERKEDLARETKKSRLEKAMFAAVAIYAVITFWQGCLTRESIRNSTRQFQIDQRPYIWTGKVKPFITPNDRLRADVVFVNFGKTPAIKHDGYGKIFWGKDAMEQTDKWFAYLDTIKTHDPNAHGILPPGIPPDIDKNAFDWTSVFSDAVLSQPDAEWVAKTDFSAVIALRDEYTDTAGNFYRSDMCFFHFASGAIGSCQRHNEIK